MPNKAGILLWYHFSVTVKVLFQNIMKIFKTVPTGTLLVGIGALILAVASFAFASGLVSGTPGSSLAAAISAFFGRAVVTVSRDANSPAGTIRPNQYQPLAVFDVSVRNVTTFATLRNISVDAAVSDSAVSLNTFSLAYQYCVPRGKSYGYGYPGGGCGIISLPVSTILHTPHGVRVVFRGEVPVYPEQSKGIMTVSATPSFSARTTGVAKLTLSVSGASASGDQCKSFRYGYLGAYGYSRCSPVSVNVDLYGAHGNTLKMRSPGYGYAGVLLPTVTLAQSAPTTSSDGTSGQPFTLSWSSTNATSCILTKVSAVGVVTENWATGTTGSQTATPTIPGVLHWYIDCTGPGGATHADIYHTVVSGH